MKKFILTEMEKKQITKLYGGLISEETETLPASVVEPTTESTSPIYLKTKELRDNIIKLLDYYEKTPEGKFIDKVSKDVIDLVPVSGYYKRKVEDIKNGISKDTTVDAKTKSEVLKLIDEIINGKLSEYFGPYESIVAPIGKIDFYTDKKRI
jgi:hypothetical protein